jgi:hypothetical protein
LLLVAIAALSAHAQTPAKHPAKATLLADVAAVRPGETFTLGVLFELQPDWHIYWLNPGDAGQATSIQFTAPEGFEVGELRWPIPMAFLSPGDIQSYGYDGKVMLTAKVKAPATLPAGPLAFGADARWLVCKELCIPGKATLKLELPAATGSESQAANVDLFAQHEKQLPCSLPCEELVAEAKVEGKLNGNEPSPMSVVVKWGAALPAGADAVAWYPGEEPAIEISDVDIKTVGGTTRVTFKATALKGLTPRSDTLTSLLVVKNTSGGGGRGVYVPVKLK